MVRLLIAVAVLAAATATAIAREARPVTDDPAMERRLMTLASELRCLVCQNQTLAESQADLAKDLRNEIREQMRRGASDRDVIAYLVARYGDFVLYRPPLKASTLLLWSGPAILFLIGILLLARTLRRSRGLADDAPLADAEDAPGEALPAAGGDAGRS